MATVRLYWALGASLLYSFPHQPTHLAHEYSVDYCSHFPNNPHTSPMNTVLSNVLVSPPTDTPRPWIVFSTVLVTTICIMFRDHWCVHQWSRNIMRRHLCTPILRSIQSIDNSLCMGATDHDGSTAREHRSSSSRECECRVFGCVKGVGSAFVFYFEDGVHWRNNCAWNWFSAFWNMLQTLR
jgi:hypothetical protein